MTGNFKCTADSGPFSTTCITSATDDSEYEDNMIFCESSYNASSVSYSWFSSLILVLSMILQEGRLLQMMHMCSQKLILIFVTFNILTYIIQQVKYVF